MSMGRLFRSKNRRGMPARKPEQSVARRKTPSALFSNPFRGICWERANIKIVASLFALLWGVLWCRAWHVQMIEGPHLARMAERQHMTIELVSGRRGDIHDRNGFALARSVECRSVYVNPHEVLRDGDPEATASFLAGVLGIPLEQMRRAVTDSTRRFIWIARKVDDGRAEAVRMAALPGVGLSREYERFYPYKHLAGQLLGFVGMDDKGLEGIERSLDGHLEGQSERRLVQRDATGRRFYLKAEDQEDPAGKPLTLTLDVQVQFFVEEALEKVVHEFKAKWAGCLVVDVPSGEVLAWGQYPFFNPNAYREYTPAQYRNRLAQDAIEPGSTLKPFVVAAALQEKLITRDTSFKCENGTWETKNITIRDTKNYDELPVHKIIRYSSNIGAGKIALTLGAKKYHHYLSQLGFGTRSALPIAESRGILRHPRNWSEADTISTAFGQSISATGVQMAQAYLTLVSGGIYKPLRLIKDMENSPPAPQPRIFQEKISREVLAMLREVVEEDGSGKKARIDGIPVGGKTGTAQKADKRSGTYGTARLASFVGAVPINKPRYLILVMVDEPAINQYGGIVAAPVFQEVASRTLAYHGQFPDTAFVAGPPRPSEIQKNTDAKRDEKVGNKKTPARVETDNARTRASGQVPNVVGKSVRTAVETFAKHGIMPVIKGEGGKVIRQSPEAGARLSDGREKTKYVLWLSAV